MCISLITNDVTVFYYLHVELEVSYKCKIFCDLFIFSNSKNRNAWWFTSCHRWGCSRCSRQVKLYWHIWKGSVNFRGLFTGKMSDFCYLKFWTNDLDKYSTSGHLVVTNGWIFPQLLTCKISNAIGQTNCSSNCWSERQHWVRTAKKYMKHLIYL